MVENEYLGQPEDLERQNAEVDRDDEAEEMKAKAEDTAQFKEHKVAWLGYENPILEPVPPLKWQCLNVFKLFKHFNRPHCEIF